VEVWVGCGRGGLGKVKERRLQGSGMLQVAQSVEAVGGQAGTQRLMLGLLACA
jgi:hypothetical protein